MKDSVVYCEKIIRKRIITNIVYYFVIIMSIFVGIFKFNCTYKGEFVFDIQKTFDFSKGIGIYNKWLIDYDENPIKFFDEKACVNGVYIFRIIFYIAILICLIYLPVFIREIKRRLCNKNNLIIENKRIYGTYFKLFKTREYNIDVKDLKSVIVRKNLFRIFLGREKLILVTDNKIIKVYYIKDLDVIVEKIKDLAKNNKVKLDDEAYKRAKKEKIKNCYEKITGNIDFKALFEKKSEMEIKLDRIKELKESKKITEEEYIQLREKIINNEEK